MFQICGPNVENPSGELFPIKCTQPGGPEPIPSVREQFVVENFAQGYGERITQENLPITGQNSALENRSYAPGDKEVPGEEGRLIMLSPRPVPPRAPGGADRPHGSRGRLVNSEIATDFEEKSNSPALEAQIVPPGKSYKGKNVEKIAEKSAEMAGQNRGNEELWVQNEISCGSGELSIYEEKSVSSTSLEIAKNQEYGKKIGNPGSMA